MASRLAWRILRRSISATVARPTAQLTARLVISRYSSSRRAALRRLESARPAMGWQGSSITAAASTSPARQPRPTSSTPHQPAAPISISAWLGDQSGERLGGALAGLAAQLEVQALELGDQLCAGGIVGQSPQHRLGQGLHPGAIL